MAVRARRIVVLGMMTKVPVPGVIWQTIHYLLGLRRLGFDVYYVEAHACTPSMLMRSPEDDGTALAVGLIDRVMRRFDLGDRWAYHALHDDGRCYGMSERALRRLLRDAELVVNLHGATLPRPEHARGGNLVYLETDPVRLQIELHDGNPASREFLEQHSAFFTFAENLGRPGCDLPVPDGFAFAPTRQPVVLDFWEGHGPDEPALFTSVGNWHQAGRDVEYLGTSYGWSKDAQWRDFLPLPKRTEQSFELALSSAEQRSVDALEGLGWSVRPALDFGSNMAAYHNYVAGSRGEFTVAKEQNVRFRTGWFSDRSATYLAAGRPVVSQDTGFGDVLPVGEGLFAVSTLDEAVAAIAEINGDYARHRRAATEIAHEYFDAERVLARMLNECGVSAERGRSVWRRRRPPALPRRAAATAAEQPVEVELAARPLPPLHPDSTVLAIIPHFKCEEWLDDCLASLAAQTRPLDGIVVIDDASDDPPTEIVRRFPQVTLLHAERNVGPYRLVQQIIEETDYDGYLFQDADDWSGPERLEALLRHAAETGAELIGTQELRVFCDEPEVTPIEWPLDVNAQFAEKPTAFPLLHPTSIVSRGLVMRLGGFASGLRFSGDAEFLRRARFVSDVVNVPELLYFRRIRQGSLTTAPATGLQSPERKRVMEMLWQRARHNAELAELGGTPHLEPCETARPVGLKKLTGPPLLGRGNDPAPPRPASPPTLERRPEGSPRPVFVVGADRSGVSSLAWALGEHPGLAAVPDGAWLGRLDEALGATLGEDGAALPDAAAAFAIAASELAAGAASRWVDGAWQHTYAIGVLADTFPEARFIHVVRDVDAAIAVMSDPPLGAAGATGGTQVPARLRVALDEGDALAQWTAANRACLDAERRLGDGRMLRIDFDALVASPEQVVRAALEFVGEEYRGECLRPLSGLRAREGHPRVVADDPLAQERATARALCRELIGKPLPAPQRTLASSRQTTRDVLAEHLPAGSTVAIVSRGDDELVAAAGDGGRHFPVATDGRWIGYHPRDDAAAIAQLQAALRQGVGHIYFPWTALWWLEHYRELRRHLERHHRKLLEHPQYGALFELDGHTAATPGRVRPRPAAVHAGRVVLVTDHFPKFSETFFACEYTGLRRRGWDIHVLCNRSNRDQWQYFPELRDELEARERIHVITDFDAQLAELRPEVVHFGYGTLARGRMHVGEQLGCKVVVSLRGYDINYFGLDDPHCYDDVWAGVDMVHAVSEDVWRRAVRRGCPPRTPHRVITDAIDVAAFTAPSRRYEDVGSERRPLRLVSVGRLHWKKGHEQALLALRTLLDRGVHARHRIIGDGPDREPILFAIHDLGLEGHVELMGARSSAEVQKTMRWADVCVQASISEGFCVSVIEAQAMGLPIVCTDADGLSENVADGETGFVVGRRDGRAIGERLVELAGDRGLRKRMGTAARARAERRFDIARQLDGLEAMYRTLAAPQPERRPAADGHDAAVARPAAAELERELTELTDRIATLDRKLQSRRAVEAVCHEVDRLVPPDARVLVVSRGDDELLELGGREAWHFPRAADGAHVRVQPTDSDAAIDALEALRSGGADYLVVPAASAWWLEHYSDFARHLGDRYARLAARPDACAIYELRIRRLQEPQDEAVDQGLAHA